MEVADEPLVTIGIKALNEEDRIASAIRSACEAAAPLGGEVILADSGSKDRTVAIAHEWGIRIVQLADPGEGSCGTGAQLAFQAASGKFFYLLDGDMTIDPGFLAEGIAYLDAHPRYAGVGGRVREACVANVEFAIRARQDELQGSQVVGDVDRLDCGGLYRMSALRQVGYFADRNLHAFEEFELGARLESAGWKLARIGADAVVHYGHTAPASQLILRRILSGYAGAPGEVLRAVAGTRAFLPVLRRFSQFKQGAAVIAGWVVAATALYHGIWWAAPMMAAALIGLLSFRFGSLGAGLYLALIWNVHAVGLIQGVLRPRRDPHQQIGFIDVTGAPI